MALSLRQNRGHILLTTARATGSSPLRRGIKKSGAPTTQSACGFRSRVEPPPEGANSRYGEPESTSSQRQAAGILPAMSASVCCRPWIRSKLINTGNNDCGDLSVRTNVASEARLRQVWGGVDSGRPQPLSKCVCTKIDWLFLYSYCRRRRCRSHHKQRPRRQGSGLRRCILG